MTARRLLAAAAPPVVEPGLPGPGASSLRLVGSEVVLRGSGTQAGSCGTQA